MRLARTAAAFALLLPAACERPRPASSAGASPRITAPPPEKTLTKTYPAPSRPTEPVRLAVFEQINRDRAEAGLSPVAWDGAAAGVADVFCAGQVAEKTRSHFLRDGVPPYARTGLDGVFGYQSENSASWVTTASVFSETPVALALSAHESMVEEKPPDDGHRRTILDPEATHVGVGWAMTGGRFQLAEEFLVHWLDRLTLETQKDAVELRVAGAARPPMTLRFVTSARELLPAPLTRAEADSRTTYRYPTLTEALVPQGQTWLRVVGMATLDRIRLGRDREFSFSFVPAQTGLYTLVFWVSRGSQERPRPGGSATIRVEP